MSRPAKGPVPYLRNHRWWARWADGRGGKVAKALTDFHGQALLKGGASSHEVYAAAAREYHAWHSAGVGAAVASPATQSGKPYTVGCLTTCYVNAHKLEWSFKTVSCYQKPMERFEHFFGTTTLAQSITPPMADSYKIWLSEIEYSAGQTLAPCTVKNNLSVAFSLMEYAFDMEMITRNPFKRIKRIHALPVREKDPFSPDEIRKILTTAREHYPQFYPVVVLICVTGQRPGAIPLVRVKDYDPHTRTLTLRDEDSKQNKGNSYPLPDLIAEVFDRHTAGRAPNERMFLNRNNGPLNAKTFDPPDRGSKSIPPGRTWYHLLNRADVRPRCISNLRKALVTNMYHNGTPLEEIVQVTGHSERVAREHYLKHCPEKKRQTINKAMTLYFAQPPQQVSATFADSGALENGNSGFAFNQMSVDKMMMLYWYGQALWPWGLLSSVKIEPHTIRTFTIPAKRVTMTTHLNRIETGV